MDSGGLIGSSGKMNNPLISTKNLIDDVPCYEAVRHLRWSDGVRCPECESPNVIKRGMDETKPTRQPYGGKACGRRFEGM